MTAQSPDILEYQGQTHRLFTNPLNTMPRGRRPGFVSQNTMNWRGYVALWEIRDDRLYLKDLRGRACIRGHEEGARQAPCGNHHRAGCFSREVQLSDLFDMRDGPLFADWFSGDLRVPQGRLLNYVHMGYGSQYERDLIITIAHGVVESSKVITAPPPPPTPGFFARLIAKVAERVAALRR